MLRFIIAIVCLLTLSKTQSQPSITEDIWNKFNKLNSLPLNLRLKGYEELRRKCIQSFHTVDSSYTNLLFLYAGAEYSNNNQNKAISLLKEAIDIANKHSKKTPLQYLAKYYFYLAYYQTQLADFESALRNFNIAYTLGIKQPNKWNIASLACQSLSHLYYDIQDFSRGLQYATLGANIDRHKNDPINLTRNLYEQCINLNELNQNKELEIKVDSLIQLAEMYANEYEKGMYYSLLGEINAKKKQYRDAAFFFNYAIDLFQRSNSENDIYITLVNLHYLMILDNDIKKIKHYENLISLRRGENYVQSKLLSNTAFSLRRQRLDNEALYLLQQALTILPIDFKYGNIYENPYSIQLKNLSQKDYAFTPLLDKAEILALDTKNKTNLKHALNTYQLLDTLVDYIRWQHQGVASKLFWREKLNSLYEHAIETAYQLNDTEKAFYFLEKSRAVLLLDQLNNNAAKNFIPQAEADKEAALRMQVSYHQNKGDPNEQLSDFLQAQAQLDEYVKDLEKRYPRYYEYKYNNHVPHLTEVQRYLANNQQSLLSYFEGKQGVYLLVVTPKKSLLKKIDFAGYYSEKQEFMSFFAHANQVNQQYHKYLQSANRFYQRFVAPLKDHLTPRVIVSTSGAIVPFAALSASAQEADYLVNHYAFSYTYSARALLNQQVHPSTDKVQNYFLGVAPVDYPYKSSLARLSGSTKALKDNKKLFQSSLLFTNEKADKASFERQWPQAKVVQLISHAYADQENTQPLIYFADSSLSLNDIHQEQAQTQLLVLSACRTGIGKDYQGEGVFSLSRGFMGTGVPSIYSTLWDVADQDAYALSHQVLKSASKEVPLDLALQEAQVDWLRKADRSKQLPNAWAGIILLGSSNPLSPEPATSSWLWYFLLISAVVTFGAWFWLKRRVERKL
jgi:CHAT domain-containing protein/tetratricopeptide (TPR) repeat protein